jgi:Natural resistance-associated macrophage protein
MHRGAPASSPPPESSSISPPDTGAVSPPDTARVSPADTAPVSPPGTADVSPPDAAPVSTADIGSDAPRERFVLDSAHVGDIQGAFGTIREHEGGRRGLRLRTMALFAIIGPGLIVMVGDNDAGGVATYSQAGQNYGTSLLWVMLLLIPVLIVNQEMVVRLGAVTVVGHARLIFERFGRFWGAFSVGDLFHPQLPDGRD